jgi:hypothetical protein
MMEVRAQHVRARRLRRGDQVAFQRLRVCQAIRRHAAEIRQHVAAGCGVRGHLWDPPEDQPDPPEELLPQLLPEPPLDMRAPGVLKPVAKITTTMA